MMKKTIMAAAVAGTMAGLCGGAFAQGNVQVYGLVDTGYIKESGSDTRMGHNYESRIGFRGNEDLGNGLRATFELEKRLNLNSGANGTAYDADDHIATVFGGKNRRYPDWTGTANVGLASNTLGAVRFGRVTNLAVESHLRIDPFDYYSVGAATAASNPLYAEQLSNTVRYDSPVWQGFSFGLAYTLGADEDSGSGYWRYGSMFRPSYMKDKGNDGFNVLLQYDNGPLLLLANYQRVADSDKSYLWNLGAAYTFGPARVSLGYQDARFKVFEGMDYIDQNGMYSRGAGYKQRDWILGLNWKMGPGEFKASVNYGKVNGSVSGPDTNPSRVTAPDGIRLDDDKVLKYALGYTWNLSKRTAVYGVVTYIDSDNEAVGGIYNTNGAFRDSMTGVQAGVRHRF